MIEPEFWRGRRVLITGHTGFKGGWLALWLQLLGSQVFGVSLRAPTNPSLYAVALVPRQMAGEAEVDIRDASALEGVVRGFEPEVIIHLAAQPLVRRSFAEPRQTFDTNVMGTVNLLEAARGVPGLRSVVVVTSDKCYENRGWEWGYREDEPMGGHDPYSSSKGAAELVTAAYRRSFFSEDASATVASARAGNVIGGGDWGSERLIPDLVRAALDGTELRIRNPTAVRPWQHVLNPLGGYLLLAQALGASVSTPPGGTSGLPKTTLGRWSGWSSACARNGTGGLGGDRMRDRTLMRPTTSSSTRHAPANDLAGAHTWHWSARWRASSSGIGNTNPAATCER